MVKKIGLYIVLICTLFSINSEGRQFGNYTSTTELEQQMEKTSGLDRIEFLLSLSSRYNRTDISRSKELAAEAHSISLAFDNDSLIAESNLQLGYISLLEEKSAEALDYYVAARNIFRDFGIEQREAITLAQIGLLYSELSQYPESLKNYYEALSIFREIKAGKGELDVLLRISMVMGDRKEYASALAFAEQTIELASELDNKLVLTMSLSQAASLYEDQNNLDEAISYNEQAMLVLQEMGSSHGAVAVMMNLSELYEGKADYSKASSMNNEVYEFAKANQNNVLLIESMFNAAKIMHAQKEYKSSNDTLFSALGLIDESGLKIMAFKFQQLLAENYLNIGKYDLAIIYAKQAIESADNLGDLIKAEEALLNLIDVYTKKEDYSSAFKAQQKLTSIRDSLYSKENAEQIAKMQARYEISEKEKEIELLQSENKRRASVQLFLGLGFLLVLLAGFFIVRSQMLKVKSSKSELEVSNLKRKELQKDLEFKNKQLTTQSLNMVQKNEMMEEMKEKVENLKKEGSSRELNNLSQLVDYSFNLDEDWKQFQMHFEEVHSGFYHVLKDRYPDLTPNEMRLSALVKLNLTIKEMAAILGISPDSVKTARYRLRKKLDMNTEDNLAEFMLQLEKDSLEVL